MAETTVEKLNISVKTNADKAAAKLRSLASALADVNNAARAMTNGATGMAAMEKEANAAAKATAQVAKSVKTMGEESKKSSGGISKFVSSLGRIAMYRLLRTILKEIAQALRDGLQYAYLYSDSITGSGHRFAVAMDNMTSAATKMKAQLGAAFIGLLTALEPVITELINLVTMLADSLSQLTAAITGTDYEKALDASVKFSDTMSSGAKSAKEWKNQLLGFDVINRLNDNNGTTGYDPTAGYTMYNIADIFKPLGMLKDYLEAIASAIGLINAIGAKIPEWLGPIYKFLKPVFDLIGKVVGEGIFKQFIDLMHRLTALVNGDISWGEFADGVTVLQIALMSFGGVPGTILAVTTVITKFVRWLPTAWAAIRTGVVAAWTAIKLFLVNTWTAIKLKASEIWGNIAKVFTDWWRGVKTFFSETVVAFIKGPFVSAWKNAWNSVVTVFKSIWTSVATFVRDDIINPIIGWVENAINTLISGINALLAPLNRLGTGILQALGIDGNVSLQIEYVTLPRLGVVPESTHTAGGRTFHSRERHIGVGSASIFAGGGFPGIGELFVAREAGPELVGTIGGRTAVANNDQIVAAVSSGVYEAVSSAFGNRNGEVSVHVYLDSREIKAGQQRLARATGV